MNQKKYYKSKGIFYSLTKSNLYIDSSLISSVSLTNNSFLPLGKILNNFTLYEDDCKFKLIIKNKSFSEKLSFIY